MQALLSRRCSKWGVVFSAFWLVLIGSIKLNAQEIRRIPVVFHNVTNRANPYRNGGLYHDKVIQQLLILNKCYRGAINEIQTIDYMPYGGLVDTHIEFFIAPYDKDGNPSPEIIQDSTDRLFYQTNDVTIPNEINPLITRWPADKYLNIFVYPLDTTGRGRGGWEESSDVLVISPYYFSENTSSYYGRGHILVHESGHWLSLLHVEPLYDFPPPACDHSDGAMNFMSYGSDACTRTFTTTQATQMYTFIANHKPNAMHLTETFVNRNLSDNSDLGGGFTVYGMQSNSLEKATVPIHGWFSAQTNSEMLSSYKHIMWNNEVSIYTLSRSINYSTDPNLRPPEEKAQFTGLSPVTVNVLMDNISFDGSIDVQDPWFVESDGSQPNSWKTYTTGYKSSTMPHGGVFLGQSNAPDWDPPYYSIQCPNSTTIDQSNATFIRWSSNNAVLENVNALQTKVKFNAANDSVKANYKGNLRTNTPDYADTKNQQRLITSADASTMAMVYESMGNIYHTQSFTSGNAWSAEVRLNTVDGAASNPTISNVLTIGGNSYYLISWVETVSGVSVLHFQTMKLGLTTYYWGWLGGGSSQDTTNHKTLNEIPTSSGYKASYPLRSDARPVVYLTQDGTAIRIYFAFEGSDGKLKTDYMTVASSNDLNGAILYRPGLTGSPLRTASIYSAWYPVIITYPSAYGYPAKTYLFFLSSGYASGLRIAQYDYDSQSESILSNPNNDYTYYSLQGAPSAGNNSYGLVADAYDSYSGARKVNFYYKPTYNGTSAPYLQTVYSSRQQPTLTVEQKTGFASWASTIAMRSPGTNIFYLDNGTCINSVALSGIFMKSQANSSDRTLMAVKSSVTPARIVKYTGTLLSKIGGQAQLNKQIVRLVSDKDGNTKRIALDITNADVEVIDTLEVNGSCCVLKVNQWNGSSIQQIDSLKAPLAITIRRNGEAVRSYAASAWKTLCSTNLSEVRDGDVITLSIPGSQKTDGFTLISYETTSLKKQDVSTTEALIPTEINVSVFPNPFNPVTTMRVSLPRSASARLEVYNMVGQKVATVLNGNLPAGYHDVRFDGTNLGSGVYFYRLETDNFVKSGKLLLMK